MQDRLLQIDARSVIIRAASVAEIIPLRHRILRGGLPIEEAHFNGDAAPATRHAGAFVDQDAICCASFMFNSWEGEPAWQLRGMATDDGYRGFGAGTAVLEFLTAWVLDEPHLDRPVNRFWCNARVPALGFYQRQGWQIVSEQFDVPTAGPHRKMVKFT